MNRYKQVTLRKLHRKVVTDLNFKGSIPSLSKILKNIGFKYCKMRDNRKIIIEKSNIQSLRAKYLRLLEQYRSEGR